MPRGRKEEPVEETPEDEEVGGVTAESVEAPREANEPVGTTAQPCVNHPDREATARTSSSGANELFFCDECARASGEGTQPIEAGQPVSAEDAAAAQAAAGPPPTEDEIAAAKAAAGEE